MNSLSYPFLYSSDRILRKLSQHFLEHIPEKTMFRICITNSNKATKVLHILQRGLSTVLSKSPYRGSDIACTKRQTELGDNKYEEQNRFSSKYIVNSPLGEMKEIPNETLVEYVFKNIENVLDRPVVTCGSTGRFYSNGMLRILVNKFAQAVLSHCGMRKNEVVGLILPNIPEFVIVCHGSMEAGLIVTFANPLYTPDEMKRQFQNSDVQMLITVPHMLEMAIALGRELSGYKGTVCINGQNDLIRRVHGLESLLTAGYESDLPAVDPEDLAILPYSSGTTGFPKGVMLSNKNLIANLVQNDNPSITLQYPCTQEVNVVSILPFFHIYGFNIILNQGLRFGYNIISLPRFVPEDYLRCLVTYKPKVLFVVPSIISFLNKSSNITKEHLSNLDYLICGSAPLTETQITAFRKKFGSHISILQGYGMTECSPVTHRTPIDADHSKTTAIGVLVPGTQAKIVDLTTGVLLPVGKSGELFVKGPQVMMGYLKNNPATKHTLDEDGWVHTGDVAYFDEDKYFFMIDRCAELIKVKGNQVSPTELENVLLEIPGIADAAVVGIPDPINGEVPKAFVVRKPEATISDKDILAHVNSKVAYYKKLAGGIFFLDTIPRSPSGKILRNELKGL